MPHPADHPAAALAITRGLPGQLQKAKQNGDAAAVAALDALLIRARRIVRANEGAVPARPSPPPLPAPAQTSGVEEEPEGWAEIVVDRRRQGRRW